MGWTGVWAAAMRSRPLMWATGVWSLLRGGRPEGGPEPEPAAKPWPPRVGDKVEMFSRWTHKWFPAVVESAGPDEGGWPSGMTVRVLGNGVGEDDVRDEELRPIDWLAAARRDTVYYPEDLPAWSAFDRHMTKHMETCGGCPECDGMDEHYPACPDCGDRRHRSEDDPCICGRYPWMRSRPRTAGRLLTAAARRDRITRRAREAMLRGQREAVRSARRGILRHLLPA